MPSAACLALALAACGSTPADSSATSSVVDGRARFREIFCTVLYTRAAHEDSTMPCGEALVHLNSEPAGTGAPVDLSASRNALTILYVPGLWSDCLGATTETVTEIKDYLARFGYDFAPLPLSGISGTQWNAKRIRHALVQIPELGKARRAVIVAHSKGVVDTLEALVRYREVRDRVIAVISLAGAVGGSPLADPPPSELLQITYLVPGTRCTEGDFGAIRSLQRNTRRAWLARHALPEEVRYYSIVALPTPDRVSLGLMVPYQVLNGIDARNDGTLLFSDQLVPGSTLLAYANADHWAVAIALGSNAYAPLRSLADKNQFPRAALLEAALRFMEEDIHLAPSRDSARYRIRPGQP